MSRFEFSLATPDDDAQLRRRMASDWMEGSVAVSFRREPSYFAGCHLQGDRVQVIKCVDRATGEIIGLGSRALKTAWVNGQQTQIGYLADLRGHPDYRRGSLLARGYGLLRSLHEQEPVPFYYSVILEGNQAALGSLVGGRAGLPQYEPAGRILTPAIHLDLPKPPLQLPGITLERGTMTRLPAILAFVNRWQSPKQLAPCHTLADFGTPRLAGLTPQDFYLAIRDNELVGVVAAWDQHRVRQTYIERYAPPLAQVRSLYNLLATVTPLKPLPKPGTAIPYFYLSFVAIAHDDPAIFRYLLRQVYGDRRLGPWHYFIAGLHEADPLAAVLAEYRRIESAGQLFIVYYPEGEAAVSELDGRVPYVEMAAV